MMPTIVMRLPDHERDKPAAGIPEPQLRLGYRRPCSA